MKIEKLKCEIKELRELYESLSDSKISGSHDGLINWHKKCVLDEVIELINDIYMDKDENNTEKACYESEEKFLQEGMK